MSLLATPADANFGTLAVRIVGALEADIHVAMPRVGWIALAVGIFGAINAYSVVATDRALVVAAASTLTRVLRAGLRAAQGGGIAALTRRTIITLRFTFEAAAERLITRVRTEEAFHGRGASRAASRAERQSQRAQGRLTRATAFPEARRVAGPTSRKDETPAEAATAGRFAPLASSTRRFAGGARVAARPSTSASGPTGADQAFVRKQIKPLPTTTGGYAQRAKHRRERNNAHQMGGLTPHLT
jgi:hypothetical protein